MAYEGFCENLAQDALTGVAVAPVGLVAHDASDLQCLRQIWARLPQVAKVVASRGDGVDRSWPGFDVRTLLAGEDSSGRFCCHSMIIAPNARFPEHSLADAQTVMVLVSGELEINVGQVRRTLTSGAFGYVPGGVLQGMANQSAIAAEVLIMHTPAGVERAFAALHQARDSGSAVDAEALKAILTPFGFDFSERERPQDTAVNRQVPRLLRDIRNSQDFAALRKDWTGLTAVPKISAGESEARFVPVEGQDTWVLLEPEESAGHLTGFAHNVAPNFTAAPHHQPAEEEFFFVVDGEIQLTVGNLDIASAPAGAFAFAPRFATHGFSNLREKTARLYTINSPGGHDRGFEYAAEHPRATDLQERVAAMGFHFHSPAISDPPG